MPEKLKEFKVVALSGCRSCGWKGLRNFSSNLLKCKRHRTLAIYTYFNVLLIKNINLMNRGKHYK